MTEYGATRAAFFDVDETLLTIKSMVRFLEFHLRAQGRPPSDYQAIAAELAAQVADGATREQANRAYYRYLAGHSVAQVAEHGKRWFAEEPATGTLSTRRCSPRSPNTRPPGT